MYECHMLDFVLAPLLHKSSEMSETSCLNLHRAKLSASQDGMLFRPDLGPSAKPILV